MLSSVVGVKDRRKRRERLVQRSSQPLPPSCPIYPLSPNCSGDEHLELSPERSCRLHPELMDTSQSLETDDSLRILVEQHAKMHAFPPPALSYGGSSSSTGDGYSSVSTSRNTSPAILPNWLGSQDQNLTKFTLPDPSLASPGTPVLSSAGQTVEITSSMVMTTDVDGIATSHTFFSSQSANETPSPPSSSPSPVEQSPCPPNWGVVSTGIYRSSFPRPEHFHFLQGLGLRTVLTLVFGPYPEENAKFCADEGIELIQLGLPNSKDPRVPIPEGTIRRALDIVLDPARHPLLIHCNRGKHRTGCVVGCLRKIQNWTVEESLAEYCHYSHPKERLADVAFIRNFICHSIPVEHNSYLSCLEDGVPGAPDPT